MHDLNSISPDISLYDTVQLEITKNEKTFIIISKLNHFDQLTYKDLFYSLKSLRSKLIKKISEIYLKKSY